MKLKRVLNKLKKLEKYLDVAFTCAAASSLSADMFGSLATIKTYLKYETALGIETKLGGWYEAHAVPRYFMTRFGIDNGFPVTFVVDAAIYAGLSLLMYKGMDFLNKKIDGDIGEKIPFINRIPTYVFLSVVTWQHINGYLSWFK